MFRSRATTAVPLRCMPVTRPAIPLVSPRNSAVGERPVLAGAGLAGLRLTASAFGLPRQSRALGEHDTVPRNVLFLGSVRARRPRYGRPRRPMRAPMHETNAR